MKLALFGVGNTEITASDSYNEIGLDWHDPGNLSKKRKYEENDGWHWDQPADVEGVLWGGCVESIDEMLRHGIKIPSLKNFENTILMAESSEEIPSAEYVARVHRAFGE
jgi:muramoyltetrapeptide carboxypeptidase LdcA involved in peptidoglycan recycling